MPSILRSDLHAAVPLPCESYVDRSLYIEDARILLTAVNINQVREQVAEQIRVVYKTASDSASTSDDFLKEVEKLTSVTRVWHQLDRVKNNEK